MRNNQSWKAGEGLLQHKLITFVEIGYLVVRLLLCWLSPSRTIKSCFFVQLGVFSNWLDAIFYNEISRNNSDSSITRFKTIFITPRLPLQFQTLKILQLFKVDVFFPFSLSHPVSCWSVKVPSAKISDARKLLFVKKWVTLNFFFHAEEIWSQLLRRKLRKYEWTGYLLSPRQINQKETWP